MRIYLRTLLSVLLVLCATTAMAQATIHFNCTKTDWSTIGNEDGEVIGTIRIEGADTFDHFVIGMYCDEDPEQFITFAGVRENGGELRCYTWQGGTNDLNAGYHYRILIEAYAFDYSLKPFAYTTYKVTGTGKPVGVYCDVRLASVNLKPNDYGQNSYNLNGNKFDVTFSDAVSNVSAWWAQGFAGGSLALETTKVSDTKWTIHLPNELLSEEGSLSIMITAWNADGVQVRGENSEHTFSVQVFAGGGSSTGINAAPAVPNESVSAAGYDLVGRPAATESRGNGIVISNGKKTIKK